MAKWRSWKLETTTAIATASKSPAKAFIWAREVEKTFIRGESSDKLNDPAPFRTLDTKLAHAMGKIISGELSRKLTLKRERAAAEDKLVTGREIFYAK